MSAFETRSLACHRILTDLLCHQDAHGLAERVGARPEGLRRGCADHRDARFGSRLVWFEPAAANQGNPSIEK